MGKWDRRDKKLANKRKMRVSGAGNRLIARIIMNRSGKLAVDNKALNLEA